MANTEFMDLTEKFRNAEEGDSLDIENQLNEMRKDMAEKVNYQKLFDKYHACMEEIREIKEMLAESIGEKEPEL